MRSRTHTNACAHTRTHKHGRTLSRTVISECAYASETMCLSCLSVYELNYNLVIRAVLNYHPQTDAFMQRPLASPAVTAESTFLCWRGAPVPETQTQTLNHLMRDF